MRRLLGVAVVMMLVSACGPDDGVGGPYGGGAGGGGGGLNADGGVCTPDTWASFGSAFFSTHCAGCHSSLSDHASVQASASQLRSVISSGAMPRGGSLSAAQRSEAVLWLGCGAP